MSQRSHPCTITIDRDGQQIVRSDLAEQEALRQFAGAKADPKVFSAQVQQQMPSGCLRSIRAFERG
jgi:hypothetical protein